LSPRSATSKFPLRFIPSTFAMRSRRGSLDFHGTVVATGQYDLAEKETRLESRQGKTSLRRPSMERYPRSSGFVRSPARKSTRPCDGGREMTRSGRDTQAQVANFF
jgi:hypothetical protein